MREILFRGKLKVDNGEHKKGDWVFGDLVRIKDGEKTSTMIYGFGEVDPSTVGQFTGLTDKNGKKIFEGDIVRYDTDTNRADNKEIHEVVFETRGGSGYFGIRVSKIETWQFCLEVPAKLMEVVGNMHDNPELLKGAEQ